MLRCFVLLMLINIPVVAFASWQENYFNLNSSYSFAKTELDSVYQQPTYLHKVTVSAEKQHLSDGYGLRVNALLAPYYVNQPELDEKKVTDHAFSMSGILFLSGNSDLSASYLKSKRFQHFNNRLNSILLGTPEELVSDIEQVSLDYTIGKDKSFFFLQLGYDQITEDKTRLIENTFAEQNHRKQFGANFLWRQTDDTLWGARTEVVRSERQVFSTQQNVDIKNYYFQAVSKYLKNSQLTVNLGRSETDNQDQFSWDLEHKTYFSDYTNIALESSRKLAQTIENAAGEDLKTKHLVQFNYQPLNYIGTELKYSIEKRERNGAKTYDNKSLAFKLSVKYQESWKVSASFQKQELESHTRDYGISQNMISLTISGDFV